MPPDSPPTGFSPRRARDQLAALSQIPTAGYPPAPPADPQPLSAAARMGSLVGAAADRGFQADVVRGLADVANRGAAGILGGPVDLAAAALRPLGYQHPAPVGGSEWMGQQMEQAGAVTPERRPAAELLGSLAGPGLASKAATGLGFAAAMSAEGKARLLADLTAGKGSGTYRLGDVTEGQGKALSRMGMPPTTSRDVMMTDRAFDHVHDKRIVGQGFSPEDVTRFAEQAMAKRAQVDLDVAKSGQSPALMGQGLVDQASGARYEARMPLRSDGQAYEPRTIYPRGLAGRNNKASKE